MPVVLAGTPAALAAKLAAIPEHVRRAYASSTLAGLPEDAIAWYRELADAGITYFIAGIYGDDRETVRIIAEQVAPALGNGPARQEPEGPGGPSQTHG